MSCGYDVFVFLDRGQGYHCRIKKKIVDLQSLSCKYKLDDKLLYKKHKYVIAVYRPYRARTKYYINAY